ncbi:glycoside hydrolase family 44 protein [Myxococcaceae bacterium GXIMD 01537]
MRVARGRFLVLLGILAVLVGEAHASPVTELRVFDDQLQNGFGDRSSAVRDLNQGSIVRSGTRAIMMRPSRKASLYFYRGRVTRVSEFNLLDFWVHGGTAGGQALNLVIQSGGKPVVTRRLDELLPSRRILPGMWQRASLDLSQAGVPGGVFDGIVLQDSSNTDQPPIYVDDIALRYAGWLTEVRLSQGELILGAGTTAPLQLTALYRDGRTLRVTTQAQWKSNAPAVATATLGNVSGLSEGSATVTATFEGLSASATVRVLPGPPSPPPGAVTALPLYDDAPGSGIRASGWGSLNLSVPAPVHSGAAAIRLDPSDQGGLYLYKTSGPVLTERYDSLEFWVSGVAANAPEFDVILVSGGKEVANLPLRQLLGAEPLAPGEWRRVTLRLPELNLPGGVFDGIQWRGAPLSGQPPMYLDDIRLLARYLPPARLLEVGLTQYQLVLVPGDTASLRMLASFENGASADKTEDAVWTSGDPSVVAVERGRVTALRTGLASVSATFGGFTASAWVQVAETVPDPVYTDGLASGFANWSWGTYSLASTSPVYSGSRAISFRAKGYEGLWFVRSTELETARYYGVRLAVHGGATGGQQLKVLLMKGRSPVGEFLLPPLPASNWVAVTAKLADMGVVGDTFDALIVQAWGSSDQGLVFLDDIALLRNNAPLSLPPPALPTVKVAVDVSADRRPLSPDIFGVNFEDMPTAGYSQLAFPFQRWGGNSMTRYNWELDAVNRGSDWYFLSLPFSGGNPATLPYGSLADRFIMNNLARGTRMLLQVPTIGWTPKDREVRWSFSVAKYGPQEGNECDWGTSRRCDAGNGLLPVTADYLTGNDPEDTSRRVGPDFVARWVDHLREAFGPDAVRHYALDNEPALWSHTHRDVHPQPATYDEVWAYTQAYASMLKQKDPGARIYGPVAWGWCEYFYSARDGCSKGADYQEHGGKPFLEWYLGKVRAHEQATGVRLVDYLDIHYYPAERSISFSSDESAETSRRRLRALRSLYDRGYRDPTSWIQTPVYLVPRMRELIDRNAPGLKLAITEYNFGDGVGIAAGLAQAEALALFAREGVDAATRWGALLANSPMEDAFKLYLDYDGRGSRILGDSVRATTSNVDVVGAYAFRAADGRRYVLLFNKDIAPRTAELAAGSLAPGSAEMYRFQARQRLTRVQALSVPSGNLSLLLPARSATLLVQ